MKEKEVITNAKQHFNKAVLLNEQGKYNEAEKEYRKAIRINSENAPTHHNLGILLEKLGKYKEAEKEWIEALRIDPNLQEAQIAISCLPGKTRYDELEARGIIQDENAC